MHFTPNGGSAKKMMFSFVHIKSLWINICQTAGYRSTEFNIQIHADDDEIKMNVLNTHKQTLSPRRVQRVERTGT